MLVKRVVDGIVIETELTQEEIENMQQENQFLKDCILEMSEIVYGG